MLKGARLQAGDEPPRKYFDRLSSPSRRNNIQILDSILAKKAGLPLVRHLLNTARRELFTPVSLPGPMSRRRRVTQRNVAPEVRSRVVTRLVEAIEETERLAKSAGKRPKAGGGGISPKERWLQLMAYLTQVLDGVLRNLDVESIREKMDQMETALDELQRTNPTTG